MELDAFIKEALTQISRGIEQANEVLEPERKKPDGTPLPKLFLLSPGKDKSQGNGVHFDIAITTQTEDKGSGGAKVRLAVVEAEMGGKISTTQQHVSRINFTVTVGQWHG